VNRTREKYESDCIKINAFTGQSALVQGRELDKLHLKLEKLQETVKINEREFGNFVRALADTTRKWDTEWKTFCDVGHSITSSLFSTDCLMHSNVKIWRMSASSS
jgi:hypothetical protein